jgi:hypothetical protein
MSRACWSQEHGETQKAHGLRAMRRTITWAEVLPCRSSLKPCLRSPFKAPMPDLPQALQRADIAAASKAGAAPEAAKI